MCDFEQGGRKEGITGSDAVRRSGVSETAAGRSGKRAAASH